MVGCGDSSIHKKVAGFKRDEVYIGTAEERAARGHGDAGVGNQTGHLTGGGYVGDLPDDEEEDRTPEFAQKRAQILENVKTLRGLVAEATTDSECEALEKSLALEIAFLEKVNKEQAEWAHIVSEGKVVEEA